MRTHTKSNFDSDIVALPLPPQLYGTGDDMEVYARFMQHLRNVPSSRMEIKILSAIQFTADIMDHSDAHVAKLLVDLGLRAPRMAFPADFLKYADMAMMRSGWEVGGPTPGIEALKEHWDRIGEDKFTVFRGGYDLREARVLA
ncbi:MAG: hypothetical protein WBK77_01725 [Alphaproteobacteria bacterium]